MSRTLQHETVLPLWNEPPAGTPENLQPNVEERSGNPFRANRALTGVVTPSLTAWVPEQPNGASIIIAPGGSYRRIVLDKEGLELARLLAPLGVTCFLLTYRLPGEGHANRADAPLADAQRAIRMLRIHADEWRLDPKRIGFLGFSAAGHLAASLATNHDRNTYPLLEKEQGVSARPDFLALVYPVITMQDSDVHTGSRDALLGETPSSLQKDERSPQLNVTRQTPETFIVHADDDPSVSPMNAITFYCALHRAGVKAELHLFRDGGHGFGIAGAQALPVAKWPDLLSDWLMRIGALAVGNESFGNDQ
ncbi:alpha/beta hydrolase [Halomonas sp. PAMB 3232]|uniref:alpha/beta hydrolase n=1 Tax=Halomonas sp. PAMB 3232 TaxID=3075221 RepID=UPI00289A1AD8|nr:alpha/beta hydrolase [Halomonas sp. PAMB 3232]WNL38188.1 alpha/beta hydrolase [Halomonas sp. PAMB 3232]